MNLDFKVGDNSTTAMSILGDDASGWYRDQIISFSCFRRYWQINAILIILQ